MFNLGLGSMGSVSSPRSLLVRSGSTMQNWGNSTQKTAANRTMQINMEAVAGTVNGVRLAYTNWSTTTTQYIKAKAAYAPTLAHNGANLAYSPVTFGGAPDVTIAVATSTLSSVGAIEPVGTTVYSDVIYPTVVARTDTPGANPVLVIRHTDGNTNGLSYRSFDDSSATGALADYRLATAGSQTGDLVTTTTTGIAVDATRRARFAPEMGVEMIVGGQAAKVLVAGASQSDNANWGLWSAAKLKEITQTVRLYNNSVGGRSIGHQSAVLRASAAAMQPDIALFWSITVNSPYGTQGERDAQFAAVLSDINWCKAQGIKPVVLLRHAGGASTPSPQLRDYRLAVIASLAGVCDTLDWGGLLGDPEDMSRLQAQYDQDGTHVTALAQEDFWTYAAPLLFSWI